MLPPFVNAPFTNAPFKILCYNRRMQNSTKSITLIALLYGFIVCLANFCGVQIPNFFQSSEIVSTEIDEWLLFLAENPLYNYLQYATFAVPTIWCILYTRGKNKKSIFINLPIAYSTIGTSGWVVYLMEEIAFLFIAGIKGYSISCKPVLTSSVLNILMESVVTFTFSYFITGTIHRKFVLPKYFAEGHLNKIEDLKQPSIKFLFAANYISVTLFPAVFLFVLYLNVVTRYQLTLDTNAVFILLSIMLIGLVISVAFTSYVEKPLKKLKKQVETIKNGNYETHVKIVANDDFGDLADTMNDMVDSIREKNQRIKENLNLTVTRMAIMVESRDNSTGGHIKRTSDCVRVFVEGLKDNPKYAAIDEDFYNALIKAAPMHDLGKIAVKDSILTKNGRFTDDEYEQMKMHSAEGARIVAAILEGEEDTRFKEIAVNVAHYHHEKWNGGGYPEKIAGEAIPLEARIMALADVFDALVSKRCYKESMTYDESFKIIEESLGSHFDPVLGTEFLKCRPRLEKLYESYSGLKV